MTLNLEELGSHEESTGSPAGGYFFKYFAHRQTGTYRRYENNVITYSVAVITMLRVLCSVPVLCATGKHVKYGSIDLSVSNIAPNSSFIFTPRPCKNHVCCLLLTLSVFAQI